MQQNPQKKSAAVPIIILVAILGVIGYFYISGRGDDGSLLKVAAKRSDEIIGKDLLAALNRLNAIKLDSSLLRDPVFASLQDFSVEIVPQAVGRNNPFLPLGKTAATASSSALKTAIPKKR